MLETLGMLNSSLRVPGGPTYLDLDLPRHLVLRRLSHLNLLGDLPVQGSQEVDML